MAINLEKMSLEELKDLGKQVESAIKGFEKRRKKEALIAAQKAAQEHGFSLEDILSEKSGSKGMPKYANPANPDQTWTGRGRQPAWVKDALAKGKKIDDLAI
ncbi:H-NS histone family protein [Roseibacterium sp. SDUM158016]|jgi:DNA-binding protein H-NS|uniref:H-NS histone family protein n=1 Tax=Roseicyclus sediminis TaxID=2980997 RepID=UPI0021D22DA3|nr:H-NS histone family protein [Roseibacterium sp. SDUM158016]MCU4651251.1 H-NS histone family protein [Roseibacterium sp. SDUM158016]